MNDRKEYAYLLCVGGKIKKSYPIPRQARSMRWFDSIGGNLHHNLKYFCLLAAAVREDSEQHNAHHGKAWHQVRAPGWATRINHRIRRNAQK